jgi:hypothetical protein
MKINKSIIPQILTQMAQTQVLTGYIYFIGSLTIINVWHIMAE